MFAARADQSIFVAHPWGRAPFRIAKGAFLLKHNHLVLFGVV